MHEYEDVHEYEDEDEWGGACVLRRQERKHAEGRRVSALIDYPSRRQHPRINALSVDKPVVGSGATLLERWRRSYAAT